MVGASANGTPASPAPLTLASLPLDRLLELLAGRGAAGTVHVTLKDRSKRIYLIDGRLAGVASTDERERLGQVLLGRGLVTEQRLAEALAVQQRLRAPLGQILLRAGAVEESMLQWALQAQAEETVLDLFQREAIDQRFLGNVLPTGRPLTLRLDLHRIVAEGVRRRERFAVLHERLGGFDVTPRHTGKVPPNEFSGPELHVLGEIDGERDLEAVARAARVWPHQVAEVVARGVEVGCLAVSRILAEPSAPTPQRLADTALAALKANDIRRAWDALAQVRGMDQTPEVRTLVERVERSLKETLAHRSLAETQVARLVGDASPAGSPDLRPVEAFLLSRINDRWTLKELRRIVGVGDLEFRVAVESLLRHRLIELREPGA
jgi:hypothetical protein